MKGNKNLIALSLLGFALAGCGGNGDTPTSSSSEHAHSFKSGTYACEDRTCTTCGKLVSATESHKNTLNAKIEPTCVNQGYSVYTCSDCKTISKGDYLVALGHTYEAIETVVSTCSHVGYTSYKCVRCEANYKTYTAALDHTFDESNTKQTPATCTSYGTIAKYCTSCQEFMVTEYLAPLGHAPDASKDKTVDPTCTSEGYTLHHCTTCNQDYKDSFIEKKGHDYATLASVEATCEHGSYAKKACLNCGEIAYVGGKEKRKAHSFGEDGACSSCSKDYHEANYLCFYNEDETIPFVDDSDYGHLVYSEASSEAIAGEVNKDDVAYLLSKNVNAIGFTVGSSDATSRKYSFEYGSSKKSVSTTRSEAYAFNSYFKMALRDEQGNASKNLSEDGSLFFSLTHDVSSETEEIPSSFPIFGNIISSYSYDDPSTWIEGREDNSNVAYYPGVGWKIDYLGATECNSYVCYVSKELMAAQKEKGMKKITLTFTNTYDSIPSKINDGRLDSFYVNYDCYAYQWNADQEKYERKGFGAGWLQTAQTMTYSDLSNMDFSEMGLEMNFGTNIWNAPGDLSGHIYLTSITFEA